MDKASSPSTDTEILYYTFFYIGVSGAVALLFIVFFFFFVRELYHFWRGLSKTNNIPSRNTEIKLLRKLPDWMKNNIAVALLKSTHVSGTCKPPKKEYLQPGWLNDISLNKNKSDSTAHFDLDFSSESKTYVRYTDVFRDALHAFEYSLVSLISGIKFPSVSSSLSSVSDFAQKCYESPFDYIKRVALIFNVSPKIWMRIAFMMESAYYNNNCNVVIGDVDGGGNNDDEEDAVNFTSADDYNVKWREGGEGEEKGNIRLLIENDIYHASERHEVNDHSASSGNTKKKKNILFKSMLRTKKELKFQLVHDTAAKEKEKKKDRNRDEEADDSAFAAETESRRYCSIMQMLYSSEDRGREMDRVRGKDRSNQANNSEDRDREKGRGKDRDKSTATLPPMHSLPSLPSLSNCVLGAAEWEMCLRNMNDFLAAVWNTLELKRKERKNEELLEMEMETG